MTRVAPVSSGRPRRPGAYAAGMAHSDPLAHRAERGPVPG